ncbi:hypothetical protein C9374_003712 [Naegleria lovaniensis]|uniref:PX domain-containing protein n=1 Tax=Naegleria lovaniensis TaxID=51637 RepID=A0AA88GZL8_NAELO|nr:uncharacterized protein C9374_003712 [Naegleria lovaniensis]KAG2393948.1 hypothetical protein C9374_003712 [Naegleria lovaniensis]
MLLLSIPSYQVRNDYVVYNINVTVSSTEVYTSKKRYSNLREFHTSVVCTILSKDKQSLLKFPSKIVFGNMKKDVIEKRLVQLEKYLQTLVSIIDQENLNDLRDEILKFFHSDAIENSPKKTFSIVENSQEEKCYKEMTHLQLLLNDSECYWLPFCALFRHGRLTISSVTGGNCKLDQDAESVVLQSISELNDSLGQNSFYSRSQTFVNGFVLKMHNMALSVGTLIKLLLNMEEEEEQSQCINDIIHQCTASLDEATELKNTLTKDFFEPMWKIISKRSLDEKTYNDIYLSLVLLGVNVKFRSNDILLTAIDLNSDFFSKAMEYNSAFVNRATGYEDEFSYISFALNDSIDPQSNDEPQSKYQHVVTNIWNQLETRKERDKQEKLKERFEIATEECEKKTSFFISLSQLLIKVAKSMLSLQNRIDDESLILNVVPEIKENLEELQESLLRIQKRCDSFIEQQELKAKQH